jgi:transposase-like protein
VARATYSDEDKARAYVVLTTNAGNIKRTVRHTQVPEGTLRGWIRHWEENGPPDTGVVETAVGDFLADAVRVRDKALIELEKKLPNATPAQLVTAVGVLTDKIHLAQGLATSRTETVHALPPADEIRQALQAAMGGVLDAARKREHELIDADIVEQSRPRELTVGTN